ncbi:Uncharacterized protein TCM_000496 [Theobroma cacao]|uniref:PLATZ transcription factor family protein n=1 Tax=Theobroma cacao TaxID=3641 RepID=A0A061DMR4_THECC|nr:Uncharacterized protein TCM_000496 [Theobroma cacao]
MEEEHKLKPCWLMPLLQAKFYSLCESHDSKNTFFCLDCMGLVLCEGCLKGKKHPHHQILQVYKASHQVAIKIGDLRKLYDISDIQPYINNDSKVVFINKRRKTEQPYYFNSIAKCETCGWQLLPGTTSMYCSIECKSKDKENWKKEPKKIKYESISNQSLHSYRKRSRKGIPRRSPLF